MDYSIDWDKLPGGVEAGRVADPLTQEKIDEDVDDLIGSISQDPPPPKSE